MQRTDPGARFRRFWIGATVLNIVAILTFGMTQWVWVDDAAMNAFLGLWGATIIVLILGTAVQTRRYYLALPMLLLSSLAERAVLSRILKCVAKRFCTASTSLARNSPLSTKMQVS